MSRDPFSRMSDDRVISRGGPVEVPQIADGAIFGFQVTDGAARRNDVRDEVRVDRATVQPTPSRVTDSEHSEERTGPHRSEADAAASAEQDTLASSSRALQQGQDLPPSTSLGYPNPKVDALLAGSISLSPGTFTERDFVDLALAALDQAGVSASLQRRVNELVADEIEDAELHVQPCGFGLDGRPCYACELSAQKEHR